ncbi:hypothetical protein R6Q59_016855 [Mikania micrantha]|uniref:Uncharacterized protein n=1 Tax=Mikania micrantha TaxID=192012 RepID=A0A5N6M5J1_9ASTR|nr:hypothetical protein E3N88_37044 [Mikania micrantha]
METEMLVTKLVTALETATAMAKRLQSPTTATESEHIYASIRAAHRQLSLFLAHTTQSQPQPSIDVIGDDDGDEPMRIGDEDQQAADGAKDEDLKMIAIETMEERMKDVSIQSNKRLKRSLSFTSLAGGDEIESARAQLDYDTHVNRLRALDLIYQFHC